jgi:hypothetical protein
LFRDALPLTAHSGWVNLRRNRTKSVPCHEGEDGVKTTELLRSDRGVPAADANVRRRSLLGGLSILPILALSNWWMKSSSVVVLRDGWVLSKDD